MSSFQTTMVGATFRPAEAKDIIKALRIGDIVDLEADPDNEYDATAVKVMRDGTHIGFIPAAQNYLMFSRLMEGEAMTGEIIAFENTLKPVLEIEI